MNKSLVVVTGVSVVALAVIAYLIITQRSTSPVPPAVTEESVQENEEKTVISDSRYLEYSPTVLEQTQDGRRVLFFYASWCPTCIPAEKSFKDNASRIPLDTTVIRVNYNDQSTDAAEKELADKYFVTYQHTFIQIDKEGKEIKRWNSGRIEELLDKLQVNLDS